MIMNMEEKEEVKKPSENEQALSEAISKLYKDKKQFDNSLNTER